MNKILFYKNFSKKLNKNINNIKNEIKKLTSNTRKKCLLVGAPARGVIFSNVCNLKIYSNILECVDDTKAKAGKYFPGLHIKVNHWDNINKKMSTLGSQKNEEIQTLIGHITRSRNRLKLRPVSIESQLSWLSINTGLSFRPFLDREI